MKKSMKKPANFYRVMRTFFWRPPFKKVLWMILALVGIEAFLLLTPLDGLIYEKGEEFSFTALLELIFILFTIFLIDNVLENQARKREDRDRESVHKAALDDARYIFQQIYSLGYEVLGVSTAEKMNESRARSSTSPHGSADRNRVSESVPTAQDAGAGNASILKFILDMAVDRKLNIVIADKPHKTRNIGWRRYLLESIDDLHTEVENYQQRYGAFLAAKATESEGSNLMHNLSSIRRSLGQMGRTLEHGDGELRLQLSRREHDGRYSLKIDGGEEQIGMFTVKDEVYGNPVSSFRKFWSSYKQLQRNVENDDANRGKVGNEGVNGMEEEVLPEEQQGGFMSGIEEDWPVREYGSEDRKRPPHHARDYLDKLLRVPPKSVEEAWFNIVHMHKTFYRHSNDVTRRAYESECCKLLRYAAGREHADAYNTLGVIHRDGWSREEDGRSYGKAELWFRRAAERGHPDAQNSLGELFRDRRGVAEDLEQAEYWFRRAADQQHADGQNNHVILLGRKLAIDEDEERREQAVKKFRQAAIAGNLEALYRLGKAKERRFRDALDRESNKQGPESGVREEAERRFLSRYRKAAEGGQVDAQCELGRICSEGIRRRNGQVVILESDVSEATHWYMRVIGACKDDLDDPRLHDAGIALAKFHLRGSLCGSTHRQVREWLAEEINSDGTGLFDTIANEQNLDKRRCLDAQYVLGAIYQAGIPDGDGNEGLLVQPDEARAISILERAAEEGHVGAQNRLGVILRDSCGADGERCSTGGPSDNVSKALDLFRKASEQKAGDTGVKEEWWNARINLGDMYASGLGVSVNDEGEFEPHDPVGANATHKEFEQNVRDANPDGYVPFLGDFSWVVPNPEKEMKFGVMYRDKGSGDGDSARAIRCFLNAAQLVEEWEPPDVVARELERWKPELAERFVTSGRLETTVLRFVLSDGRITSAGRGIPTEIRSHISRPVDRWPVAEYELGIIYDEGRYGCCIPGYVVADFSVCF